MSNSGENDFHAEARRHLTVFGALAVCTLLVVGSAFLPIDNRAFKIGITLTIATVEAVLVAAFLMHLVSERKMILGFLVLTGVFFVALLALPIFSDADHISHFFR